MRHLIARQIFDVRLPSHRDASGTQKRLSRFFWEEAAPALEKLFDRLAPPGRLLRLDRLEIDLGNLNTAELSSESTLQRLISAVEEAILRALRDNGPEDSGPAAGGNAFDQWLFFLETGTLPWYSEGQLPADWENLIPEWLGLHLSAAGRARKLLGGHEQSIDRLVLQFDETFLVVLATLLTGKPQKALGRVSLELKTLFSKAPQRKRPATAAEWNPRRMQSWLWKWVFHRIAVLDRREDGETLAADFLRNALPAAQRHWIAEKIQRPKGGIPYPVLSGLFRQDPSLSVFLSIGKKPVGSGEGPEKASGKSTVRPEDIHPELAPPFPPEEGSASAAQSGMPSGQSSGEVSSARVQPPGETEARRAQVSELPDKEDRRFVLNAGIVLLHSYLPKFFTNLDLLGPDKKFRDRQSREKAAALIHFLATGETEAPEYQLLLPKILCGIPTGLPVDRFLPISVVETEEANTLLGAVISHWTALGKVSPAGLREGFFRRNGQLTPRDQGWQLRVERQTLDILLDQAPFSIGVVKLPWMKDILWVEW